MKKITLMFMVVWGLSGCGGSGDDHASNNTQTQSDPQTTMNIKVIFFMVMTPHYLLAVLNGEPATGVLRYGKVVPNC
jgi:hypothetical protein